MTDEAKKALLSEAATLKTTAHDIATSGAYLYPFKGLLYLLTTPRLWPPFLPTILKTLTLGLTITTTLFIFTYIPQTTLLAFTSGPLAPISAALLVLQESATLTNFLARALLFRNQKLVDIFDAVLVQRGFEDLVSNGREIVSGSTGIGRLGKLVKRPSSSFAGWVHGVMRSAVLLPLNFVPVVGGLMVVYVQGRRIGPGLHERYFQLKGWSAGEREGWVGRRRGAYTGLGIAAVVLEMVPFASMVFAFSNAVGAALWAAEIEKGMR